jgi:hypothetical protein
MGHHVGLIISSQILKGHSGSQQRKEGEID